MPRAAWFVLHDQRTVIVHAKVPLCIVPVDALPVTPGAKATKIRKGRLRQMAEALLN